MTPEALALLFGPSCALAAALALGLAVLAVGGWVAAVRR